MEKQTPQVDAWIKYIWNCIQGIMDRDAILDPNLPFREVVVMALAGLAEGYFDLVKYSKELKRKL